jgi:DnaJ-class molecular chaperone
MDYYQTLGIDPSADNDTIKTAYKKLAMKHHPDRGGDTTTFQTISQAYDTLSDPGKRAQYDAERQGHGNGQQFHWTTGSGNPFDPFSHMFGGGNPFEHVFRQQRTRQQKNRDLNIRCTINLKQAYTGTELEASYQLPSGKRQTVLIKVPAGMNHGQSIRYSGMGDDSVAGLERGDLMVTVLVESMDGYDRVGNNLIILLKINPLEAMIGCTKNVSTLDDRIIKINMRPGVQHSTEFLTRGLGFKDVNSGYQGDLIVHVIIDVPTVTDPELKTKIENLYAEINNTSRPNS